MIDKSRVTLVPVDITNTVQLYILHDMCKKFTVEYSQANDIANFDTHKNTDSIVADQNSYHIPRYFFIKVDNEIAGFNSIQVYYTEFTNSSHKIFYAESDEMYVIDKYRHQNLSFVTRKLMRDLMKQQYSTTVIGSCMSVKRIRKTLNDLLKNDFKYIYYKFTADATSTTCLLVAYDELEETLHRELFPVYRKLSRMNIDILLDKSRKFIRKLDKLEM